MKLLKIKLFFLFTLTLLIGLTSSCTKTALQEPTVLTDITNIEVNTVFSKSFRFTCNRSKPDKEKIFNDMVNNYMNNLQVSEVEFNGESNNGYALINFVTRNQTKEETSNTVTAQINLKTELGDVKSKWFVLDKPFQYEKIDADDYYLVNIQIPSYKKAINWANINDIEIAVKDSSNLLLKEVRIINPL